MLMRFSFLCKFIWVFLRLSDTKLDFLNSDDTGQFFTPVFFRHHCFVSSRRPTFDIGHMAEIKIGQLLNFNLSKIL